MDWRRGLFVDQPASTLPLPSTAESAIETKFHRRILRFFDTGTIEAFGTLIDQLVERRIIASRVAIQTLKDFLGCKNIGWADRFQTGLNWLFSRSRTY